MNQVEIRTLSGEVRYGRDNKEVMPALCGSILLPKNHEMLIRVCEHRRAVLNGTYKPKQLSEETMRKYRLRPEYAKPAAAPTLRTSEAERAECERRAKKILDEHEEEQRAIHRNRLLLSAL